MAVQKRSPLTSSRQQTGSFQKSRVNRSQKLRTQAAFFVFTATLLVLIAFWLRVENLDVMPPGLSNDEAADVVYALHISQTGNYPLYEDPGQPEPLFHIVQGIAAWLFGPHVWTIRLTSALVGALTIAAAFQAGFQVTTGFKHQTRRIAALAAAASLAIAIGHITLTRTTYRAVPQPLFMLLFVCFLARGLRRYQWRDFAASGVSLGLAVHSYTAALLLPGVIAPFGLALLIFRFKQWRKWFPGMVALVTALLIILSPLIYTLATNSQAVLGRATSVSGGSEFDVVEAVNRLTLQLFTRGDENPQYNAAEAPILPPIFNVIFGVGLLVLLARIYRPESTLILSLLVLAAVPAVAALDVTHGLRINGEYAVFPLIVATGVAGAIWGLSRVIGGNPIIVAGLLILTLWNVVYARATYADYWQQPLTWRMYDRDLPFDEWFFRTDRRELAAWLIRQNQPMLVPLDELNQQTTRAWLAADYPYTSSAGDEIQLPPETLLVVPWALESNDIQRETRHYGLLHENTITLLPPFSEETHAALMENIDQAEEIQRANGTLMARVRPLETGEMLAFQPRFGENLPVMFGNDLQLNGWRGENTVTSGQEQTLIYTLDWESRQARIGHFYTSFLQLQTQDFQRITGDDVLIWRWLLPTSIWQPGQVVYDRHALAIPADLTPGAYRLVAGAYVFVTEPLAAYASNGELLGDSATIGWIKVPQANEITLPLDAVQVDTELAGTLILRGALVVPDNNQLRISLYWESLENRPNIDATIFVHITDSEENMIAQQDSRPWNGQYPTFIWDRGELVQTDHILDLQGTALDDLQLMVGMYTFPDLNRLPVIEGGEASPDGRIRVGKIRQIMSEQ